MKKTPIPRQALIVTDHAVVRYCERVLGMDMEGVRRVIHDTCAPADAIGASRVLKDGFRFEMQQGRVVTITTDNGFPSLTSQRLAVQR